MGRTTSRRSSTVPAQPTALGRAQTATAPRQLPLGTSPVRRPHPQRPAIAAQQPNPQTASTLLPTVSASRRTLDRTRPAHRSRDRTPRSQTPPCEAGGLRCGRVAVVAVAAVTEAAVPKAVAGAGGAGGAGGGVRTARLRSEAGGTDLRCGIAVPNEPYVANEHEIGIFVT